MKAKLEWLTETCQQSLWSDSFVDLKLGYRLECTNSYVINFLLIVAAGDAVELLKEYKENQELVRSMGLSNYQIVYPVQWRHRETMGISTREIGSAKVIAIECNQSNE